MTRHLLEIDDLTPVELGEVLGLARQPRPTKVLAGMGVALVMEKPSARTRSATELAVAQLGGHPVTIRGEEVGLDVRESAEDLARTWACYYAVIGARVLRHATLGRMAGTLDAADVRVPVVNLLSDLGHPCQALADLLTLGQSLGPLGGRTVAYVGDANNVCRSLALAATMAGMRVRVASPEGFGLAPADVDRVRRVATGAATLEVVDQPSEAVRGADAVYSDVWTSMGSEAEAEGRRRAFRGFTVDQALLSLAAPGAVALHCLPVHRGEEMAAEVVDGPRSLVWRQAANRLPAMRGLLMWLAGTGLAGARPGDGDPFGGKDLSGDEEQL